MINLRNQFVKKAALLKKKLTQSGTEEKAPNQKVNKFILANKLTIFEWYLQWAPVSKKGEFFTQIWWGDGAVRVELHYPFTHSRDKERFFSLWSNYFALHYNHWFIRVIWRVWCGLVWKSNKLIKILKRFWMWFNSLSKAIFQRQETKRKQEILRAWLSTLRTIRTQNIFVKKEKRK